MGGPFAIATVWVALALLSTFLATRLRVSTALVEIAVGVAAGAVAARWVGAEALGAHLPWLVFLASTGAVVLTFLAGAELDPSAMRSKATEVSVVGLVGFLAPFVGATLVAHFVLHWAWRPSGLAGVALSTTSMAVVYAVMLELGLNRTEFGRGILGACFVNDLGTVIVLGLLFAPFTGRTLVFAGVCTAAFVVLPVVTPALLARFGGKPTEVETMWVCC